MNELAERSRWYNALSHNCTTTIRHHAEAVGPSNPWDWCILANGRLDELLYERGAIDTSLPFADLRERSDITEKAKAAGTDPGFSRDIREGLPGFRAGPMIFARLRLAARATAAVALAASISEAPAIDSPVLRVWPERGEVAEPGRMRLTRNQEYPQGYRGFESLPLRQNYLKLWRGVRVADGARLESVCTGKTVPGVRIPPSPPR